MLDRVRDKKTRRNFVSIGDVLTMVLNLSMHLFVAKYSFDLPPPNLSETPLMMSMGVIFAMIVDFLVSKWLQKAFCIPSESLSAKMERVLASLRVQSYNAKKRNPNFLQICGVSKC